MNKTIIILLILLVLIYLFQNKLEKFEEIKTVTKRFKFLTIKGDIYLKLLILPLGSTELIYTKNKSESNTEFKLDGNYIKSMDDKYIKINTVNKKQYKLSDNYNQEPVSEKEYWSPLILFVNKIYYETCPRGSECYYRCFLNTTFDNYEEPVIEWVCPTNPTEIPILKVSSFDLV